MKTINALLLSICLASFISTTSLAQALGSFFKYEGVELMAELAHPTSTYQKGYYTIYDNAVDVEIYYTDGVYTKVRLYYNQGWFTGVKVLKDTDWFPPFLGIEIIKEMLFELGNDENAQAIQTSYEKWLNKKIGDCSGKDITLMVMMMSWAAY